ISGSIMNAIIGYLMQNMMQKGLSSFLEGGGGRGDAGGLKSALSSLGGLNRDHALVQHVQQNAGIQDQDQATQYTQHGVSLLNEQANNNPQGLQSLLGNFLDNSGSGSNLQQGKGGLLGDILGG
ncbi:MAG TPA: hypothetical protein VE076_01825, partial [Nitrososphaeraceae archaeon]|nr:hypothetical protein [Nitrososphaeraceae archaeon]